MPLKSKLPNVETSIFSVMTKLALKHDALNISQGYPDFDTDDKLKELVYKYMMEGNNQYAPMPGIISLRDEISRKADMLYGTKINPETEITVTSGATQAIYNAVAALVGSGDEVIVIEPAYDSYIPTILVHGGIPISYEMNPNDFSIDWSELKSLITDKTRMIIVNSPHNPSGKVLEQEDIDAIKEIIQANEIYFIFDEVYEHLIYDGKEHLSALKYPEIFSRSFVIYSFGKAYHNTGWKIGYCIAPEHLTNEFRKIHQFNVFSINHPMQHALAEYMKDDSTYLNLNSFYQEKRNYFDNIILKTRFKPIKCYGTYFQMVSYADISDEDDMTFAKRITKEYGVASIPISPFYHKRTDNKIIRFCFAKTNELMDKASERLQTI
jgi:methionine aminotransferase